MDILNWNNQSLTNNINNNLKIRTICVVSKSQLQEWPLKPKILGACLDLDVFELS